MTEAWKSAAKEVRRPSPILSILAKSDAKSPLEAEAEAVSETAAPGELARRFFCAHGSCFVHGSAPNSDDAAVDDEVSHVRAIALPGVSVLRIEVSPDLITLHVSITAFSHAVHKIAKARNSNTPAVERPRSSSGTHHPRD